MARLWIVTDPFSGDRFEITLDERHEALDKYAIASAHEKDEKLRQVADRWWLAYWQAKKKEE